MKIFITTLILLSVQICSAQQWVELMQDGHTNFYTVKQSFEQEWAGKSYTKGQGWKQYKRWEWFMEDRTFPTGNRFNVKALYQEREEFMRHYGTPSRSANWQPLGPFEWQTTSYNPGLGRVNVITEDPANNSILYAGVPSGGIWKSTDAGGTWTPLGDEFSAMGVSGIVVDHQNSNTIYISTGDGDGSDTYSIGVMKSTDGGATWQTTGMTHLTSQSITSRRIIMHPTNNQILLVATNDGLYKTTDAGNNWTQVLTGSIRDVEYKPGDPMTVYTCTDQFYRSTDGGNSFTQVTTGLPASNDVNRMSVAVSPDAPSVVYILAGNETDASFYGLYRSSDSGQSFTLRTNTPNMFTYDELGTGTGGQSWYDMALAVNPTNYSEVFIGGINVWRSQDGGSNFDIVSHWVWPSTVGYTHADIHTLDFFGSRLYCGSDGGLFKSTDYGDTWNDITAGMQIMQFYRIGGSPQNANKVAGGAQDNGSYVRNGMQWTHVLGADGMEAAYDPTNQNIVYVTSQNGGLNRSTDGGATFSYIAGGIGENGGWVTPYIVLPGNTIIAGYENVWKSTNGGSSWTQISSGLSGSGTVRDLAVCKTNTNVIAASYWNELFLTQDGGAIWTNISISLSPGNSITDIQIHPQHPSVIWITTSGFSGGEKVYVTQNSGVSWTNISANLPNLPANAIVFQEGSNGGLYVGMDVGIYYTDSTLSNWQPYDQNLPNVIVNELEIHYGAGKLRAATYGRGLWESDLYTPSTLPPVADFLTSSQNLCPGDSIRFTDASLNAAPGWTWYFPGGSPATSNLANPSVYYSTAGTYTASLVVANGNGTDSIAYPFTVNFAQYQIQIDVLTDNYPGETSWEFVNASGNIVVQGGGYSSANTLYSETICLDNGCYDFNIYDTYGDGICCGFGNGNYVVTRLDSNIIVANGGNFSFSETTPFCLGNQSTNIYQQNEQKFTVFPNPVADNLYIYQTPGTPLHYVIFDMTGKEVISGVGNGAQVTVQTTTLSAGAYILQINQSTRFKMLKQ